MFMPIDDFSQALKFLAEMCSKQGLTDKQIAFYYKHAKLCEMMELRRAMDCFATRGRWPTVSELCRECGISTPATAEERANAQAKQQDDQNGFPPQPKGEAEREYGFWCFRSEVETAVEFHANEQLEQKTRGLKGLGWNVWAHNQFAIMRELMHGNHKRNSRFFVRDHFAFRFATPNPERDQRISRILQTTFAP